MSSQQQQQRHTKYEMICHPLFLAVAAGLNLPAVVFGALGFAAWCEVFSRWFIGNACLCGINIIAALYSVYKIRRTAKLEMATDGQEGVENINIIGGGTSSNHIIDPSAGGDENSDLIIDIDTEGVDIEKDEEDTDSNNASSSSQEDGSSQEGNIDEDNDDRGQQQHQHQQHDEENFDDDVENNINGLTTNNDSGRRGTSAASKSSSGWGCCSRLIRLKTISSDRIRHLICYDGALVTYSILFFVWLVWLSDGAQQLNNIDSIPPEESQGCEEFHERYMYLSLVCGFTYFAFVMLAVLLSLCRA